MKYKAIAANSKIYFGKDIPNMFMDHAGTSTKPSEDLAEEMRDENWLGAGDGLWVGGHPARRSSPIMVQMTETDT